MKPEELRDRLKGVIAFPTTPFTSGLSLDLQGLRSNLKSLLQHPMAAVVAAAGTGEMFSLSPSEHKEVLRVVLEEVNGKVPVLAATGFNPALGVEMVSQATALGVQGVLCFPPYYPGADKAGLLQYYKTLANATELGCLIYSRDWVSFTPAEVHALADEIPNLVAWKDGQADMRRYQQIMALVGDRLLWIGGAGDDCVPGYYSLGIRTYTSSIANVVPKLSLLLHETAAAGKFELLNQILRDHVLPLYALRARRKGYEVSAMKAMMDMAGLTGGPVRPPLVEISDSEQPELQVILDGWKQWM